MRRGVTTGCDGPLIRVPASGACLVFASRDPGPAALLLGLAGMAWTRLFTRRLKPLVPIGRSQNGIWIIFCR